MCISNILFWVKQTKVLFLFLGLLCFFCHVTKNLSTRAKSHCFTSRRCFYVDPAEAVALLSITALVSHFRGAVSSALLFLTPSLVISANYSTQIYFLSTKCTWKNNNVWRFLTYIVLFFILLSNVDWHRLLKQMRFDEQGLV